jgi:predicted nucleotidyltransferase
MKKIGDKTQALRTLQDNKHILVNRFGVTEIAIFGSCVRNEQRKRSDIDILVSLKKTHKNFDNYMELKFFLSRIVGRKIDLVIKDSIREELKPVIFSTAAYA